MSHPGPPQTPEEHRRQRLRRILLGVLYLSALSLLIVWEYRERLEVLSSECTLRDQVKSSLYNRPYEKFLAWAAAGASHHVITLAIPEDLEDVQKNLCLGRSYMANVLRTLATQGPAVVVIDKFYSAGTCATEPSTTRDLIAAVRALTVPVIIAESTTGLESKVASSCLVRKPQLDFGAPNVIHAVARLNSEPERLPLRWLVLASAPKEKSPAAPEPQAEFADSLSFAAAKAFDPALVNRRSIAQLIAQDDHAYADIATEVPNISTTQLLCSAADDATRRKWSPDCASQPPIQNLRGQVVVLGAENTSDEKIVLDKHIWGFVLQARYMDDFLSGSYLRYLPITGGFALFALFIFLIEGLPTILLARRPQWRERPLLRYAYSQRRFLWVIFWTVTVIVLSALLTLSLRYLPPLLVYGDILLVAVTRLLFFIAESAEHPFLHAHSPRKEHQMSTSHEAKDPTPAKSPESSKPWTPDEPIAPAPVPVTHNTPGSEGATEG